MMNKSEKYKKRISLIYEFEMERIETSEKKC